jgi:hypothetical protein
VAEWLGVMIPTLRVVVCKGGGPDGRVVVRRRVLYNHDKVVQCSRSRRSSRPGGAALDERPAN